MFFFFIWWETEGERGWRYYRFCAPHADASAAIELTIHKRKMQVKRRITRPSFFDRKRKSDNYDTCSIVLLCRIVTLLANSFVLFLQNGERDQYSIKNVFHVCVSPTSDFVSPIQNKMECFAIYLRIVWQRMSIISSTRNKWIEFAFSQVLFHQDADRQRCLPSWVLSCCSCSHLSRAVFSICEV